MVVYCDRNTEAKIVKGIIKSSIRTSVEPEDSKLFGAYIVENI